MAQRQFVIFRLEKERYGIDIQNVSSISEYIAVTKVPEAHPLVEGVINLRGDVIPVVSLKRKFNFADSEADADTRIIIYKSGSSVAGFLVDEASQVISLNTEDIETAPAIIRGAEREYIAGIGKVDDRIIVLLDLNRLTEVFAGESEAYGAVV